MAAWSSISATNCFCTFFPIAEVDFSFVVGTVVSVGTETAESFISVGALCLLVVIVGLGNFFLIATKGTVVVALMFPKPVEVAAWLLESACRLTTTLFVAFLRPRFCTFIMMNDWSSGLSRKAAYDLRFASDRVSSFNEVIGFSKLTASRGNQKLEPGSRSMPTNISP